MLQGVSRACGDLCAKGLRSHGTRLRSAHSLFRNALIVGKCLLV